MHAFITLKNEVVCVTFFKKISDLSMNLKYEVESKFNIKDQHTNIIMIFFL